MAVTKHEAKTIQGRAKRLIYFKEVIAGELAHLLTVNKSKRPWHMPIIAAIAISLPVFMGAHLDALSSGIKASLGAMVILNVPLVGTLWYRMVTVMVWSVAMAVCVAFGLIAQQISWLRVPIFMLMAFGIVAFSRYYRQPPPAGLFVLMAGAIAVFIPVPLTQILPVTGLVMMGSGTALLLAFFYTLFLLKTRPILPVTHCFYESDMLSDSLIIASFVSLALATAMLLKMAYPYWVAMSCFIIMQGMQLRTIWIKQFHRLLGTLVGMGLASWLLSLGLTSWEVAVAILILMLCIESLVDRHYALAVVFITPLTICIAEYGSSNLVVVSGVEAIIHIRMIDTALGCAIGLGGGVAMHSKWLRGPLRQGEKKLMTHFSRA